MDMDVDFISIYGDHERLLLLIFFGSKTLKNQTALEQSAIDRILEVKTESWFLFLFPVCSTFVLCILLFLIIIVSGRIVESFLLLL